MLTVDKYAKIRLAHRDGMSIREIARAFHHSRRKVREVLNQSQPVPYTRSKPPPAPVLGSFHASIDAILAADEDAPPKQRHTAMQIYRRLRDEHAYSGGYDQVRRLCPSIEPGLLGHGRPYAAGFSRLGAGRGRSGSRWSSQENTSLCF
jgi:transposase